MAQKGQKRGAERTLARERERQAIELRKAGLTYDQIAARLQPHEDGRPLSRQAACAMVKRAMDRLRGETSEIADEVRALETERLDALLASLWDRATGGDDSAVDRVLRIMKRRAELLGLDAPAKSELSSPGGAPLSIAVRFVDPDGGGANGDR